MRILRVAQKLYPEVTGGGPYHVHAMSRDQAAMGHDVTVLTVDADMSRPVQEQRDGYTVIRYPQTVSLLGNDLSAGVATFLRTAEDFDVIHAHSHLYASTNLAALKRQFSEMPLAVTNHGLYSQNAPEWLFDLYLRTAGRWTFNRADVIFCYTDEDRRRVTEFGVTSPIEVVANGVDTDRFTPEGPTSDRIDHDEPVVLFVGRLVEGKRPQDAVKAVSQLPDRMNARLYIVGDGPMRTELEAMASNSVRFLGQVPYDEMPRIYRAAVSSHLEHTAPLVEQAGATVPVGAINAYCEALQRVIADGQRLGDHGRQAALDEFQWAETVTATTERLEQLL